MIKKICKGIILFPYFLYGQCASGETAELYPLGPYKAGDVVEVCYELEDWDESNWVLLNGFQIDVSDQWILIPPTIPPNDNFITSNGNWLWLDSSVTYSEGTVGPGWFYEWVNSVDNNPLNDPGDWTGNISSYQPYSPWRWCFEVKLKHLCEYNNLTIEITAMGDSIGYCDLEPFMAYEGENLIDPDSCITHVYIPTAFTPNGDGLNDILYVEGQAIRDMKWLIYDRWENLVFESYHPSQGWDGGNYSTGVFTYIIDYITTSNKFYRYAGPIMLIK